MSKKLIEPEKDIEYKFFFPPTKYKKETSIHIFQFSGYKIGNSYLFYNVITHTTTKMSPSRFDFLMRNQKIGNKKTENYKEPVLMHLQEGEAEKDYAKRIVQFLRSLSPTQACKVELKIGYSALKLADEVEKLYTYDNWTSEYEQRVGANMYSALSLFEQNNSYKLVL